MPRWFGGLDARRRGVYNASMTTREQRQKLYDGRWRKARRRFLAAYPFCADHAARGMSVVATVVDHIDPHRGDYNKFWDRQNWQSLCDLCHNSAKQKLEKSNKIVGCDADGWPLAKNHLWNSGEE